MSDHSREDRAAEHISKIAARSDADVRMLVDALHGRSWPGGGSDRSEPSALAWLRRWRPSGPSPAPLFCGCADGRCLVCN